MDPFLTCLNSLPKVALGPMIIIITGANIKSIISLNNLNINDSVDSVMRNIIILIKIADEIISAV